MLVHMVFWAIHRSMHPGSFILPPRSPGRCLGLRCRNPGRFRPLAFWSNRFSQGPADDNHHPI
jgi:hypothetical protein